MGEDNIPRVDINDMYINLIFSLGSLSQPTKITSDNHNNKYKLFELIQFI